MKRDPTSKKFTHGLHPTDRLIGREKAAVIRQIRRRAAWKRSVENEEKYGCDVNPARVIGYGKP